jgi:glutamine amidotransferase
MKKICIIDYGVGNLASIYNAIRMLNSDVIISNHLEDINNSSHLILPGVGSFKSGMDGLKKFNLIELLNEQVLTKKKNFLGICLGMQLIFSESEEDGVFKGLNWIKGKIIKIPKKTNDIKIPHMGWNDINFSNNAKLYKDIENNTSFYFVHSYKAMPINEKIITGTCVHGSNIVASLESDNIFATQFHPEKSHEPGTKLLKNFINN